MSHPSLIPGTRVGRYVIEGVLGAGGMAMVYRAHEERRRASVALKVLHPHLARDRSYVEMFADEAAIGARLRHPNTCPVYDAGRDGAYRYIAFPLLDGRSLHDLIGRIPTVRDVVPTAEWLALACHLVAEAAEGLHAAHELRHDDGFPLEVVHRDVTPSNVFVGRDGSVRIVDFGIASGRARHHRTIAGTIKGTPSYMSPEQLVASPVDRRADVWGLGVVLWEALTCQRLHRKSDAKVVLDTLRTKLIPPAYHVEPLVPVPLADVAARALSSSPDRRHATARDFARHLRRAARALPRSAGPTLVTDVMSRLDLLELGWEDETTVRDEPVHALSTRILPQRRRQVSEEPTARIVQRAAHRTAARPRMLSRLLGL